MCEEHVGGFHRGGALPDSQDINFGQSCAVNMPIPQANVLNMWCVHVSLLMAMHVHYSLIWRGKRGGGYDYALPNGTF